MLRLGLIENVRRMALRTVAPARRAGRRRQRRHPHRARPPSPETERSTWRWTGSPPTRRALTPTFVSRFLHQLRVEGGALPAVVRLEQWIADEALSAEEATARSTQRLALTQVVMANSITSLRAIGHDGVAHLRRGPEPDRGGAAGGSVGLLRRMTFATRDQYRHVVERIARRTRRPEEAVARRAIELARAGAQDERRQRDSGRRTRPRRLLPDRRRAGRAGGGHRLSALRSARRSTAGCGATRTSSSSAACS